MCEPYIILPMPTDASTIFSLAGAFSAFPKTCRGMIMSLLQPIRVVLADDPGDNGDGQPGDQI